MVARLRRGVYAPAEPETDATAEKCGLSPQTVRSVLTTFGAVVKSYPDQGGVLPRNVIALFERPKDADPDDAVLPAEVAPGTEPTAKSWTLTEVGQFREAVRDHRLFACWLLSCYGLRRSEVLGLGWTAVDLDTGTLSVRRGRVSVGAVAVEGAPKSRRSRRDLPLPADVTEALRALRQRQRTEALALGVGWSHDGFRLVHVGLSNEPVLVRVSVGVKAERILDVSTVVGRIAVPELASSRLSLGESERHRGPGICKAQTKAVPRRPRRRSASARRARLPIASNI